MNRWQQQEIEDKLKNMTLVELVNNHYGAATKYIYSVMVAPRFLRKTTDTVFSGKNKKYFDDYLEGKRWRGCLKQGTMLVVSPLLKETFDECVPQELHKCLFDDFYNGTITINNDKCQVARNTSWGRKYNTYECISTFANDPTSLFTHLIEGVSQVLLGEDKTPAIDEDYWVSEQTGQISKLAKTKINDLYSLGILVEEK